MGTTYQIGLMAGKNVAKKVDDFFANEETKKNWNAVKRIIFEQDDSALYKTCSDMHLSWFKKGEEFLKLLDSFNYENGKDNAYKCIILADEGCDKVQTIANFAGQEAYEDFDVINSINYPEEPDYEADANLQYICNTAAECECDISAEVMAGLLMDEEVSTEDMFENLANAYRYGSEEFRSGLDRALSILTKYSLVEIARLIEKEGESLGD